MTVAELITKLQAMPQDAKALSWEGTIGDWVEIVEVSTNDLGIHLETQYDTF